MKYRHLQARTKKIEPAMKCAAAQEGSPKNLEGGKYGYNPYATGKSIRVLHASLIVFEFANDQQVLMISFMT
jgi:hypothetical protein